MAVDFPEWLQIFLNGLRAGKSLLGLYPRLRLSSFDHQPRFRDHDLRRTLLAHIAAGDVPLVGLLDQQRADHRDRRLISLFTRSSGLVLASRHVAERVAHEVDPTPLPPLTPTATTSARLTTWPSWRDFRYVASSHRYGHCPSSGQEGDDVLGAGEGAERTDARAALPVPPATARSASAATPTPHRCRAACGRR